MLRLSIQQPGAVGKAGILITDQSIEARVVAGASRFDQSINGRSDLAQPRALRRHRLLSRAAPEVGDSRSRTADQEQCQRGNRQPSHRAVLAADADTSSAAYALRARISPGRRAPAYGM